MTCVTCASLAAALRQDMSLSTLPLRHGTLALSVIPAGTVARGALLEFAPDLVVSLTPAGEMARLGAGDLPDWLAAKAIAWHPFPVEDFATPPEGADWPALGRAAATLLDTGGRLVIHCRAGLGRSGMIALRLMVEAGEAPEPALTRLRAARPGAVETPAQYRWATGQDPSSQLIT